MIAQAAFELRENGKKPCHRNQTQPAQYNV